MSLISVGNCIPLLVLLSVVQQNSLENQYLYAEL